MRRRGRRVAGGGWGDHDEWTEFGSGVLAGGLCPADSQAAGCWSHSATEVTGNDAAISAAVAKASGICSRRADSVEEPTRVFATVPDRSDPSLLPLLHVRGWEPAHLKKTTGVGIHVHLWLDMVCFTAGLPFH